MSFAGAFPNAPKVGGINLVTGGGSKITDPLGIFKTTPPPPPVVYPTTGGPWQGTSTSGSKTLSADAATNASNAAAAGQFADALGTKTKTKDGEETLGGTNQ